MFRLVSLLVVVAAMAIMWVTMAGSATDERCDSPDRTTTSLRLALPAGVEQLLDDCR